jgi:tRNA dimethylallyltransferase
VNGDSRQIYRHMDIGTAKPTLFDRNLVAHHLFDIVDPDDEYNLPQFQSQADKAIRSIWQREKTAVLVGGSGQYIIGLLEGWEVPHVAPDPALRQKLEEMANQDQTGLFKKLEELDPEAAHKIDSRNIRRVIRALEVCLQSGGKFSEQKKRCPPDYHPLIIGLTMRREELYQRTDARVEEMFRQGLLEETRRLLEAGYNENLPAMSSIGYRQAEEVIRQQSSLENAIEKVKNATHRYIRHQYAWFRLKDERINWFEAGEKSWPEIKQLVSNYLT